MPLKNGDEIHLLKEEADVSASEEIGMIFVVLQDMSVKKQPQVVTSEQLEIEPVKEQPLGESVSSQGVDVAPEEKLNPEENN